MDPQARGLGTRGPRSFEMGTGGTRTLGLDTKGLWSLDVPVGPCLGHEEPYAHGRSLALYYMESPWLCYMPIVPSIVPIVPHQERMPLDPNALRPRERLATSLPTLGLEWQRDSQNERCCLRPMGPRGTVGILSGCGAQTSRAMCKGPWSQGSSSKAKGPWTHGPWRLGLLVLKPRAPGPMVPLSPSQGRTCPGHRPLNSRALGLGQIA